MSISRLYYRQQSEEEQRPDRVVGREQVVNVDSSLSCHDQVDHENQGQERERDGGLVGLHRRPLVYDAGRQGLHAPHDRGCRRQDNQAEEQSGPEPVVVQSRQGGLRQGHPD